MTRKDAVQPQNIKFCEAESEPPRTQLTRHRSTRRMCRLWQVNCVPAWAFAPLVLAHAPGTTSSLDRGDHFPVAASPLSDTLLAHLAQTKGEGWILHCLSKHPRGVAPLGEAEGTSCAPANEVAPASTATLFQVSTTNPPLSDSDRGGWWLTPGGRGPGTGRLRIHTELMPSEQCTHRQGGLPGPL